MARVWKFGADVDTDQIVPGRYAPYMRPNEDVGSAAFIEAHPQFNQEAQPGDVIIAGSNFGCGSSREYAPLALKRRQIGAIIAESFARIFFRNAINLGIPIYVSPEAVNSLDDGTNVSFDLENDYLVTENQTFNLPPMAAFTREIIEEGGIVSFVRKHGRFPGE